MMCVSFIIFKTLLSKVLPTVSLALQSQSSLGQSAPISVAPVTTETLLVSTERHHSIHQLNCADHTGEVATLFSLSRRALWAYEALEQQITLVDVFVVENVEPLFMGFLKDSACLSTSAPPMFRQ